MRLSLIFYFALLSSDLLSQPKVHLYDYFGFDSFNDYDHFYNKFQGEGIKGNVKELRKISSRINLHLRLNKQGEIVECLEYGDTSGLSRVKIYSNRRIIKETAFYLDNTKEYTFYKYDKSGKLLSIAYSKDRKNRAFTVGLQCTYNDKNQLILRNFLGKLEEIFVYEGDSITWKLIFGNDKSLRNVTRRFTKMGYELVTRYNLDTLSDVGFKERIVPSSEYETRWDKNGNIIETGEYSYDSSGNRIQTIARRHEYDYKRLIKSTFTYNTDDLKGESSDEYFYHNNGLLKSTTRKHGNRIDEINYQYDEHGNVIRQMGFTLRYSYDINGNWILKESFHKGRSSYTRFRNGVRTTQWLENDTWLMEEKREISYF